VASPASSQRSCWIVPAAGVIRIAPAFPPGSDNPAVAAALRDTSRNFKRGHIANTIFCFIISAAYVWAVGHFWNVALAITAFLIMAVVIEYYAQTPGWIHFVGNAILWGSSVLVWYALCKQT
jgi:hypothetical protein